MISLLWTVVVIVPVREQEEDGYSETPDEVMLDLLVLLWLLDGLRVRSCGHSNDIVCIGIDGSGCRRSGWLGGDHYHGI